MKVWIYVKPEWWSGGEVDEVFAFSSKEKAERWCELSEGDYDKVEEVEIDAEWRTEMEDKWPHLVCLYTHPEQPPKVLRLCVTQFFRDAQIPYLEPVSFMDYSSNIPKETFGGWNFYCWAKDKKEAVEMARHAVKEKGVAWSEERIGKRQSDVSESRRGTLHIST